jgi:hypothetical protein
MPGFATLDHQLQSWGMEVATVLPEGVDEALRTANGGPPERSPSKLVAAFRRIPVVPEELVAEEVFAGRAGQRSQPGCPRRPLPRSLRILGFVPVISQVRVGRIHS